MPKRKQKWQVGSIFLVPLANGTFAVGQVVGIESSALNSVSCIFSNRNIQTELHAEVPDDETIIASLLTTHDLLDIGIWKVISHAAVLISSAYLPFEHTRKQGWIGAKVYGSRNVTAFLDAYFLLAPWDDWHDPNYLDKS